MLISKFFRLRWRLGSTRIRANSRVWKITRLNVATPCASTHYAPRLVLTKILTIRSTTYLHPQSRKDDFDFDTNHNLPAYFAPGPASMTCLPHFPADHFSSPSRPTVLQAIIVACYAHSSSHGRPCMAQATVEPNAQQLCGHVPPLYGANSSFTTYAAAAPIMEQHGLQQTQNARQPRTLVPQRRHPYPQVRDCSVKASNSVFGLVVSS